MHSIESLLRVDASSTHRLVTLSLPPARPNMISNFVRNPAPATQQYTNITGLDFSPDVQPDDYTQIHIPAIIPITQPPEPPDTTLQLGTTVEVCFAMWFFIYLIYMYI